MNIQLTGDELEEAIADYLRQGLPSAFFSRAARVFERMSDEVKAGKSGTREYAPAFASAAKHLSTMRNNWRKREEAIFRKHEPESATEDETPACAAMMDCLCACHAAGLPASELCDTSEDRARQIAAENE